MRVLTQAQTCADDFDRALSLLLIRAERCVIAKSHTRAEQTRWKKVAASLRAARPIVRAMMHPETRAETI